ncbi:E4 ORFB [Polar bear adenovirus 1]|uniref:E4 ORFB n=1 Tax=Polar bear adenovirus 1 TaxID=2250215 RepID=A0A345S518_9ADEN|nr:E4 ORFB [Polar bear adenovirus 1]AXI68671.1 E4 ORFB [Polar bear adenovirus 1]
MSWGCMWCLCACILDCATVCVSEPALWPLLTYVSHCRMSACNVTDLRSAFTVDFCVCSYSDVCADVGGEAKGILEDRLWRFSMECLSGCGVMYTSCVSHYDEAEDAQHFFITIAGEGASDYAHLYVYQCTGFMSESFLAATGYQLMCSTSTKKSTFPDVRF